MSYLYGLVYRPYSFVTVPAGAIAARAHEAFRYGVVEYVNPLTDDEVDSYQLVDLQVCQRFVPGDVVTWNEYRYVVTGVQPFNVSVIISDDLDAWRSSNAQERAIYESHLHWASAREIEKTGEQVEL